MGDPTLTMNPIVPAKEISATETMDGIVLSWEESDGDFDGYNLYRINTADGESSKVNSKPLTDNKYTDIAAPTGKFKYQLRTVKLMELPNNSYYTMGHSTTSNTVNFVSSVEYSLNDGFNISPNPSFGTFRLQLPEGMSIVKEMKILDLTGRIVYESNQNMSAENTISLELPTGTYLLFAKTDKKELVEKIQIIR